MSRAARLAMVDRGAEALSLSRQSGLLDLSRSGLYYRPRGPSAADLALMALIDRQYLKTPFYGARRMAAQLCREGFLVGRKRVGRLMGLMGLEAIYQKPRTSLAGPDDPDRKVYPYLLKGLSIDWSDQVWASDITYIPMARGFLYLVAVMDWASRLVLSWRLSNSLEATFCVDALEVALACYGSPEIFNTDQGSQFTGLAFTGTLRQHGIAISMDGKGHYWDNIFVERLWRSLKYEEVYLRAYETVAEARTSIGRWIAFYNDERLHQALGYRTPREAYAAAGRRPMDLMDNAAALTTTPQAQQQQQKSFIDDSGSGPPGSTVHTTTSTGGLWHQPR